MSLASVQQRLEVGIRRHQRGDIAGAASLYSEILAEEPRNPDAWHLSGLIAFHHNRHAEAETCIRQALSIRPAQEDFLLNLGSVLLAMNRAAEAEQVCRDVLHRHPKHGGALIRLGSALLKQGRYDEAQQSIRRVLERQPDNVDALCNLGVVLIELKQFEEAQRFLLRAKAINPSSMQVHLNLGVARREAGNLECAAESLNRAIALVPDSAECFLNRGNVRMDQGDVPAALDDFQHAVALNPQSAMALNGFGRALQVIGHSQQAQEAFDLACQLDAPNLRFESNRLYCASLSSQLSLREVFEKHAAWGQRLEQTTATVHLPKRIASNRRLRIGYLSPDFRNHATMRFFLPLLKNHSRRDFEVFCYSETSREDSMTETIRQNADEWRRTSSLTDEALVRQIVADEIDVLVDLAGHTAGNRLPAMAARPAPVQVSFLGYPNSTGLSRIDYLLTDAIRESDSSAEFFTEELVFLPNGACCFQPGDTTLQVSTLPCDSNHFVTFGSTHRLEKISPQCLALWSQVLNSVQDSRLYVFRDVLRHAAIRKQLRRQLQAAGVDSDRVDLGWDLPSDHLEIYSKIDILLDVFPWGSGTTAYESMWMGVPIPTILGDRGACRATASMMHCCGLSELVATDAKDYPGLVAELAADRDRLRQLRTCIRPAMQATVCDGRQFATDIETAYRAMLRHRMVRREN